MALSRHHGAVIPSARNPAMKVMTFQWPPGASSRHRAPPLARPYRRIILVVAPVSSRNTSFEGSQVFCHSCQRTLASLTSSRACSVANTVFFIAPALRADKTTERRVVDLDAALLPQMRIHLRLAPVRMRGYHLFDKGGLVLQNRASVAANPKWLETPPVPPVFYYARRRACRYVQLFTRRPRGQPAFNGLDKTLPK